MLTQLKFYRNGLFLRSVPFKTLQDADEHAADERRHARGAKGVTRITYRVEGETLGSWVRGEGGFWRYYAGEVA